MLLVKMSIMSFIRSCLVILLVLLQSAAPLIHAHLNSTTEFGTSWHLPEFEQINTLLKEGTSLITPSFHEGEMVTVSAGIKHKQQNLLSNNDSNTFVVALLCFIVAALQYMTYCFFIKTDPTKNFHHFNLAAPRAPPLFSRSLFTE